MILAEGWTLVDTLAGSPPCLIMLVRNTPVLRVKLSYQTSQDNLLEVTSNLCDNQTSLRIRLGGGGQADFLYDVVLLE